MKLLDELRQQTIDTNAPDMNYDTAFKILASKNPRLFQQNRVRFFEIPGLESYQGSTKEQVVKKINLICNSNSIYPHF